jgi:hypothetical protein
MEPQLQEEHRALKEAKQDLASAEMVLAKDIQERKKTQQDSQAAKRAIFLSDDGVKLSNNGSLFLLSNTEGLEKSIQVLVILGSLQILLRLLSLLDVFGEHHLGRCKIFSRLRGFLRPEHAKLEIVFTRKLQKSYLTPQRNHLKSNSSQAIF